MTLANDVSWLAENWARIIVAATSTGTLGFAGAFYRTWRKGRTDDLKTDTDADGKLRDHYAAELQSLRDQIRASGEADAKRAVQAEERHRKAMEAADDRFNRAMTASDEREAASQAEIRLLREEVRKLSEEIFGLRKNVGQAGRSAILLATHSPSADIVDVADRAATALGEHEERLRALPHSEGPDQ